MYLPQVFDHDSSRWNRRSSPCAVPIWAKPTRAERWRRSTGSSWCRRRRRRRWRRRRRRRSQHRQGKSAPPVAWTHIEVVKVVEVLEVLEVLRWCFNLTEFSDEDHEVPIYAHWDHLQEPGVPIPEAISEWRSWKAIRRSVHNGRLYWTAGVWRVVTRSLRYLIGLLESNKPQGWYHSCCTWIGDMACSLHPRMAEPGKDKRSRDRFSLHLELFGYFTSPLYLPSEPY